MLLRGTACPSNTFPPSVTFNIPLAVGSIQTALPERSTSSVPAKPITVPPASIFSTFHCEASISISLSLSLMYRSTKLFVTRGSEALPGSPLPVAQTKPPYASNANKSTPNAIILFTIKQLLFGRVKNFLIHSLTYNFNINFKSSIKWKIYLYIFYTKTLHMSISKFKQFIFCFFLYNIYLVFW